MSSRRRITIALVGMIVLVIVGWLARGSADGEVARDTDVRGADRGPVLTTDAVQSRSPESFIIDVDG
ncbi:hypothetical protein DFQ14_110147 [Halopolyspora algeriensis]|uniref:Uncharacterized protein n=1 Tax=Halopolyspora algeriensis TaxID=1500506 RepID=A0A368VHT1_9ACTN|nr:hypothetical protein [Halopolyspora algeriensis]RCW40818.1 hypothetical protein DFQ14_110147 [Halopolyspora algeriensis]TQM53265.1 hypothetical protein FHU43_2651 [Halopolyspora algeriensis]